MASKLRFSLAACLLPVVLSTAGAVHAAAPALATQPSCSSTGLGPSDAQSGGGFGAAVAVDGQTAMVADPFYSTAFVTPPVNPPYTNGRVSVFTCDATTQAWTNTASIVLPATDANQSAFFAFSVALQGNLAAVGSQDYGVWVYKRQGLNWNQIVQLLPGKSSTGEFTALWGSVIALDDHMLALGVTDLTASSNNLYVDVYQIVTVGGHGAAIRIARLKPPAGDTGTFGASLAMHGDTLVVGDPPTTTAYVYKRRGFKFELEQKITGAEATTNGEFGTAVAISKDVILVGAPQEDEVDDSFGVISEGGVYAFRHESGPNSPWVETQHFSPASLGITRYAWFGGVLAVNRNGQAVIGSPRSWDVEFQSEFGPTFLYTLQGGQFVLSSTTGQLGAEVPATALSITDEYLLSGQLFYAHFQIAGAQITNLSQLPAN
jgi:hypothetical protein